MNCNGPGVRWKLKECASGECEVVGLIDWSRPKRKALKPAALDAWRRTWNGG